MPRALPALSAGAGWRKCVHQEMLKDMKILKRDPHDDCTYDFRKWHRELENVQKRSIQSGLLLRLG